MTAPSRTPGRAYGFFSDVSFFTSQLFYLLCCQGSEFLGPCCSDVFLVVFADRTLSYLPGSGHVLKGLLCCSFSFFLSEAGVLPGHITGAGICD